MVVVMVIAGVALGIVYFALRIIFGWILPKETMAAWDRGLDAVMAFVGKLIIVILGLGLLWFGYEVWMGMK